MDKSEILEQLHIDREAFVARREYGAWRLWAMLLIAALLAGLGWYYLRSRPVHVQTVLAVAETAQPVSILDATGYVVARRQATVSAKITGKVEQVLIEEGQEVQAGDILARLDDIDARAQLNLSLAQKDAARSQLEDISVQLAQAERDWRRLKDLSARRLASVQASEQARANRDSLQARLLTQQLQLAVAEQSVQVAQVNLDNTIVRAPFTGVVVAKTAQPGEIVSPISAGGGFTRTGIGTIVDMDSLEIEVDVNEAFIGRVQPGQPVEARLNAYPQWVIGAAVIAIIPTADRSKATVKVRIAIQQKDTRIVPEMGVRVAFLDAAQPAQASTQDERALLLPATALRLEGSAASVFVVENGTVKRQSVQLGASVGERRIILSGLSEGERVVLSPPAGLRDGAAVIAD